MRSIATLRSLLWSPRLPITQPARAGLGGTNGSAQDQSPPRGTRRRFESPQRRSEFGDFTGRLARKTNGASSHVVARTANGAVVVDVIRPVSTRPRTPMPMPQKTWWSDPLSSSRKTGRRQRAEEADIGVVILVAAFAPNASPRARAKTGKTVGLQAR